MERPPIHVDEFGTIRFKIYDENGSMYEFEQEDGASLLFITMRDLRGKAISKKILNIELEENKEIVETYQSYISTVKDKKEEEDNDDDKKQRG